MPSLLDSLIHVPMIRLQKLAVSESRFILEDAGPAIGESSINNSVYRSETMDHIRGLNNNLSSTSTILLVATN